MKGYEKPGPRYATNCATFVRTGAQESCCKTVVRSAPTDPFGMRYFSPALRVTNRWFRVVPVFVFFVRAWLFMSKKKEKNKVLKLRTKFAHQIRALHFLGFAKN